MSAPEAFQLLSVPGATLDAFGNVEHGVLDLVCITLPVPNTPADGVERNVYLILRLNMTEAPIDPSSTVQSTDSGGSRIYTISSVQFGNVTLTISITKGVEEDLGTLDEILTQYVEVRAPSPCPVVGSVMERGERDLRGHLVMINEDTGEVIGEVEDRFNIREDPIMHDKGHENDPVVIEIPELPPGDFHVNAQEVFARIIPADQQDWITKSASIVSHAISMTTNLLLTTITAASSYYVAHSPHPSSASPSSSRPGSAPPPPPPRALVFLTSERTRKGLQAVHSLSGQAVKVSSMTISRIDGLIRKAMGANPKRERIFASSALTVNSTGYAQGSASDAGIGVPAQSTMQYLTPPPYSASANDQLSDDKASPRSASPAPPIPPRMSPKPLGSPPPLPSREGSPASRHPQRLASPLAGPSERAPDGTPVKLTRKERILISADLILSTLDNSARRVLDVGVENIGKVVGHRYGDEAAQSSLAVAGIAKNAGLVYIDMRGIGRRALLSRAGKTFVTAQMKTQSTGS